MGLFRHNHIVVGGELLSPNRHRTLNHEIAHYYFTGFPKWLTEGGADFLASNVDIRLGALDTSNLRERLSYNVLPRCDDAENIRHQMYLLENIYLDVYINNCEYRMGEHLLWSISDIVGEEVALSALRELLSKPRKSRLSLTEEEIYQVFLKHAPSDRKEEIRDLYRRLHGGAFAFSQTDFSDNHGDDIFTATTIAVGDSVIGQLDYMFDFDFFRFQAEESQRYRMNVDHESLGHSSVMIYDSTGVPQQPYGFGNWKSRWRAASGPQILWVARFFGQYYFAVQNFEGRTGPYTLTITTVDDVSDDHSDGLAGATPTSVGQTIEGVVDNDFDYDYFLFEVEENRTYRVDVVGDTLERYRMRLFESDGNAPEHWYGNRYRYRDNGGWEDWAYIEWTALSSGDHYIAIDGVEESVGTYTLKITVVDTVVVKT